VELEPGADQLRRHYHSILNHYGNKAEVKRMMSQLARIIAFSEKNNSEILVVYFPYKNELDTVDLRKQMPREVIKKFCDKKNIALVDLTQIFLEKSKKESVELYLPGDITHLNAEGSEVVAQSVFQFLVSEKLIN
jgi:lysophospholipase L1-like esterase